MVETVKDGVRTSPIGRPLETVGGGRQDSRRLSQTDEASPQPHRLIEEIDLRHMGRSLWRWRTLIGAITLICVGLSVVVVQSLTPWYTATTQIVIGSQQGPLIKLSQIVPELKGDDESIATEIGILRSRKLAQRTIAKLGLDLMPDFEAAPGLRARLVAFLSEQDYPPFRWLRDREPPEARDVDYKLNEAIDIFLSRLRVRSDGRSRIVALSFTATEPELASRIVNTLADFYVTAQLDAKLEAAKRANIWLTDQLSILRQNVLASEDAVEKFRRDHNLVRGQTSTITSQEISQAATEAVAARTKKLEAQSRLIQVQRSELARGRVGSDISALPEVLQSPLIQTLRAKEAEASQRLADLVARYGDKHPSVINARAELADITRGIQTEVAKIGAALRTEVANQQARENSMNALLEKAKADESRSNLNEVQLHDLEREAQANSTLYESLLQHLKETQSNQSFQQADAEIISAAPRPSVPSFPQKTVLVLLSTVTGFAIGVILALVAENRDVGVRSMEQVKQVFHLNPLGMVPLVGLSAKRRRPEREVIDRPLSAYSEAMRTLQANILLSDVDVRPKTILVTSSLPGEGKSTTAVALAHLMARDGQRVLLVDCDLRRPALHELCLLPSGPGLADWLLDKYKLEDIIQVHEESGLNIITAGHLPSVPPNLLGSHRFQQMLGYMRARYDVVLLDSAPVLAIADTRALSALADKTVIVVRWANTSRKVLASCVEQLRRTGADIAGVVLSRVDVRSHAKDGFSDSVLYTGRLKHYYR
jgi:succinoglycan biosynthesis transport protein ExoP